MAALPDRVSNAAALSTRRSLPKSDFGPLRVVAGDGKEGVEEEFDPAAPPPFTIGEIRAAIPKHCWNKDPWRSLSYVARDVVAAAAMAVVAAWLDSWAVWPLYWLVQGTLLWALFVLGHDWYCKYWIH